MTRKVNEILKKHNVPLRVGAATRYNSPFGPNVLALYFIGNGKRQIVEYYPAGAYGQAISTIYTIAKRQVPNGEVIANQIYDELRKL